MAKLHKVYAPTAETKFLGEEPSWEEGEITEENYKFQLHSALNWHTYCASDKNYRKYLEEWLQAKKPVDAKSIISAMKSVRKLDPTSCSLARIHMQNFPLQEKHINIIEEYISTVQSIGKKKRAKKKAVTVNRPSVQDAMKNQLSDVFAEIDGMVDSAFSGEVIDAKTMMNGIFKEGENIKVPHIRLITKYIEEKYLNEWNEAIQGNDEDLAEGYSFIGKRAFNKVIKEFNGLVEVLSKHATKNKTQRISKKKPMDKRKMVGKMKYMENFTIEDVELSSEDPVNIIGANVVWSYDTKKRKIGFYESEVKNSLYVKGTTIYGYKNSSEKILRKPEEQLKEFKKLRKNQIKSWFDSINVKEKEMNGRTNVNVILLRVD